MLHALWNYYVFAVVECLIVPALNHPIQAAAILLTMTAGAVWLEA